MGETAIYARISEDREGDAAGIERQVEDALALAEARGFTVADRFIDNDRSAYNGKARPEWDRLLGELRAGSVTNIVAWASDRLYRRTRDQLDLMEAVRLAGGIIATVKDGDVDPSSAEGRMRMTILSSVAEFESSRKAERVSRAAEQRAATGRPHGRPSFGWRLGPAGEWVLDHDPAALIREASARVLRGESCFAIVDDWNRQGLATAAGAEKWDHRALRKVLRRPANAGLRIHRGKIVGPATFPPILDMETWTAVVSRLGARGGQRRPRRYLLTGIVMCADDGERMVGHKAKIEGYECVACGRRIASDRLDDHVVELVLTKLATPRLAERLAHARSDSKEANALRDLDRAHTRLAEIAELFGSGDLDLAEYQAARSAAQDRRADAERRLSSRRSSQVLGEAIASPEGIRDIWERQGVAWRREVIRAVVARIEIGPAIKSAWDPTRVRIAWC
jgi:DNA invertase Pin-like site-specific DNA recombinase